MAGGYREVTLLNTKEKGNGPPEGISISHSIAYFAQNVNAKIALHSAVRLAAVLASLYRRDGAEDHP
jgi:hypothetical protein